MEPFFRLIVVSFFVTGKNETFFDWGGSVDHSFHRKSVISALADGYCSREGLNDKNEQFQRNYNNQMLQEVENSQ